MLSFVNQLKKNNFGRSVLSVILAVAVLCSTLSMVALIPTFAEYEVWDGTTQTAPVDSDNDGVYEITNAEELAYVVYNDGTINGNAACSFILTDDIYINDPSKINWTTGEAIGSYTINSWFRYWKFGNTYSSFAGTIDGDGHIVYGLYFKNTEQGKTQYDAAALIPGVNGTAVIKNLGVDNAYVNYSNGVSAFVGYALTDSTVNISNSFAGANVTLIGNDAGVFRAVARDNINCVLENCYSLANTVGTATYGLIGFNWEKDSKFTFKNCYNATGPLNFGGGPGWYCVSQNSYATADSINAGGGNWLGDGVTVITADKMQGQDVFTDAAKMPNLNLDGAFEATDTYPVLKVFAKKAPPAPVVEVWDGTTQTAPVDSDNDGVYEITNAEELAYVVYNDGTIDGNAACSFILTNDIYINDINKVNWATGEAIGSYTINSWFRYWKFGNTFSSFAGTIDGDGHIVYGLYFKNTEEGKTQYDAAALIPGVKGTAVIKNLGVDNAYVNYSNGASAFVGYALTDSTVNISNSFAGANVTIIGNDAGVFRAVARENKDCVLENCYSLANTVGSATYGLVGFNWDSTKLTFKNCYNATGPLNFGGGPGWNCAAQNSYSIADSVDAGGVNWLWDGVTVITSDNMKGQDVFSNTAKMPNLNTNDVYEATSGYPILKLFKQAAGNEPGDDNTEVDIWDGTTTTAPTGDGTQASPYLITNGAELAYAISNGGGADTYYKLTSDIYLNDIAKIDWATGNAIAEYTPNAWFDNVAFQGNIDGDGHVVYGLYFKTPASTSWSIWGNGLIPKVAVGTSVSITKLGVDKAYISGKHGVSAFVGCAGDNISTTDRANVTIDQCYVGAEVTLKGHDVGTFRGTTRNSNTTIKNSYSLAAINATGSYGLVGSMWTVSLDIDNCYIVGAGVTTDIWSSGVSNIYATQEDKYTGEVEVLTAENMKGASALTNMPNLNVDDVFVATDSYPVLKVFVKEQGGEEPDPGPGETPDPGPGETPDPGPGATVTVPDYVWDGTEVAPTEGDGSSANPYLIKTAEELAYIIKNGGGANTYYKLANDIYLNAVEHINWETGAVTNGYTVRSWYDDSTSFQGTIDGDGHVIYGLYYKSSSSNTGWGCTGAGLIPHVELGESVNIINLGIDNAYVSNINGASAFVGFAGARSNGANATNRATVNISYSFVGANVTIIGNDAAAFRAGTYGSDTTLKNVYSLATLNAAATKGLGGNLWSAGLDISNCYIVGAGVTTDVWNIGVSNIYATQADLYTGEVTVLTTDNMQGLDVFTNENKMPGLNADNAFIATDSYPVINFTGGTGPVVPDNPSDETVTVPDYVWDRTEVAPTKGDGSKKNPYLIGTAEELAYVIANGGGQSTYYKLTADIYLNATEYINWATGEAVDGYVPRTWYDNVAFQGTINGDGYMVYGLYFKTTKNPKFGYWGEGLIPRVNPGTSATVTKLGVDYAYVSSENAASAFVGFAGATSASESNNAMANVSIDKCFVGANTTIKGWDVGAFRGGTRSSNTSIVNAYSLATLDGASTKGLIGNIWDASVSIENAYNANGAIISDTWLPNIDSGLKNVYATDKGLYKDAVVELTTDNMKGLDVFTNEAKMLNINVDDAFVAQDGYPVLKVFTDLQTDIVVETPGQVWTGTIAEEFAQGEGTEDDPYIISTAAELAYAIKYNGFGGKYFELSHDIFLNDISNKLWYRSADCNEWFADSAGFNGHIDGKGHIVYGIWYPNGNKNKASGLIPVFMSGTIKNIGVRNAQINAEECAGGIVGKTVRTGMKTVESCFVDETVFVATNHTDYASGGIVGMAYDTTNAAEITLLIKNCYSKASLSGMDDDRKNGILGGSWRTPYSIINCYSVGYPVYNAQHAAEATSAFWNYHPETDKEGNPTANYKNEVRNSNVPLTNFIYNNYSDVGELNQWTNQVVIADPTTMRGSAALTSMPELDYVNVFQTVEGGTPKLKIFTSIDGKDIFSSQDADFFGAGRGSMDDPFIIRTAEHLRYVVESLDTKGKYYKLGNDIYVNDTTNPNWMSNNPATWYSEEHHHSFAGHFDGAGYKIYGLYVNEESPKYQGANYKGTGKEPEWINHGTGLFPYIDPEASVRNTHIRNSYLAGKGTVGGIAGNLTLGNEAARLQIIACSVDETVTLKGFTVGGLIGASHTRGIDLTYCYGSAKMSNTGPENRVSGLVGDIWGAKLSAFEAYTTEYQVAFGSLVNTTALYGPVDQFGVIVLNKSDMIGAKAKNNMKFTWDKVWYTVDGKTPQLNVVKYGEEESLYDEGVEGRVWSGKVANNFAGGSGTKDDPYLIYTPEQLARIFALQSAEFTHYKLMADIKLNNTSKENWENTAKMWYAGGYFFRGVFDGNGHVVSGLYYKNENNTDNSWAGLFQGIGHSSVIKRVGVIDSTVINKGPNVHSYAAAICGYLEHWDPANNKDGKKVPEITECFGSDSVYIEATAAAGILAATQTEVIIKNCYFTGELTGTTYSAGMVADNWGAKDHGPSLINCYAATLDADPLGDGYGDCGFNDDSVANKRTFITDCYIAGSSRAAAITPISVMYMKGADAKKYMPKLDFKNVWMTVNDGTPVLRCFGKNASKYSSTRNPKEVAISFGNLGDAVVEPLRGYPGYTPISKDELPVPERRGFIFNGWHHFNPDGCEFELELFPNYDITLYANWTEVGFTQNFDKELNEQYDYNEGIEIFKPGLAHYNTKYVHSGWRSLHTLKNSSVDPEFLVSYEDTLLVGYEYEISFWMTTDTDGTSGKLYFEQSNYGDVNDEIVGYQEALTFSDLKDGEWKQYTVKIVANAPYLIVRAEKGTSLYFEDFEGIPTGAKGELGNLLGYNPGAASNGLFGLAPWLVAIIIGGAVLVLGGAAVVVIVVTKKKA